MGNRNMESVSGGSRNDDERTERANSSPAAPLARPACAEFDKPAHAPSTDDCSARLVTGNAGDHKPIHALLRAANQSPSYEDFVSWLDEPTYEPSDRLLVKTGSQLVAHLQVFSRVAWFGGVRLPVGGVQDLATLPEYRGAGHERLLLESAEQAMRENQAVTAFARANRADAFLACGWTEVRDQRFTEANVNDILARLSSTAPPRHRRVRSLHTRLWRQVELDSLERVYRSIAETLWGALDRNEPYWRWLVGRKAHDELIVAVHGRDNWEELDRPANIVGYAVTRGSQLVELAMLPGFGHAGRPLLLRACQDAIERGHRTLSLHLPIDHPLHELMIDAGGHWSTNGLSGTLLVKLLDPGRWIESLYPVLLRRARAAGVKRPCHLVIETCRQRFRLDLTRRSGRLESNVQSPLEVRCTPETFASLLVGNLDVAAARETGNIECLDDETAARLAALFPPLDFWQSQFDLLRF